ncbi:unnamed protein product [Triticum turgidum subsp. durum]|uniref:Poly(A) polymerase nucleotidyltransferase domain-containing protein n=1 Tax=Triticum turgidum subsp. durum TaxID=4567 RepID=A0A9R0XZB0_TRITD|nr:unnamed protein product [Triticum turgidum subsp. durum]
MAGSVGTGRVAPRSSPKRYSGMDPPLSLTRPTMFDLQKTAELEKFLVEAGLYESEEQSAKREEVLREIDGIVKEWVKQLTSQKGYSEQMIEKANVVLFTFGSYRLGVTAYFSALFFYSIHLVPSVTLNNILVYLFIILLM